MNFATPRVLWLAMTLLPLLIFFLWWTWRKRQRLIGQFVQNRLLAELTVGVLAGRQKARLILLVFAVGFLLLAMARPRWGFTWEEATVRGRDIIVAMDTSRSMLAEDIQPNRLARAKLAALDLVRLAKYDRLGVVAFAGSAFLQCPLTLDDEAFRQSIEILKPGIIPQGGSALAEAITTARDAFSDEEGNNHKIIVLFTDGEDHEQGVLEQARVAALDGVRIFTIGVGTAAGEMLRVPDANGNMVFLKDGMGNAVKSRLNEPLLQQLAAAAHGFYLPLQGGNPMQVLYEKGLEPLPTSEKSTRLLKQFKEQYYWPLAIAILLLILELFLPERKRSVAKPPNAAPAQAMAVLLFFLLAPGVEASSASALRNYSSGNYQEALGEYRQLLEENRRDPRLQYNAGAAAYRAGELDYALSQFQSAAASPDLDIQQRSFYNMGNSLFRLGQGKEDPQERMQSWQEAVSSYEAALKLNPADADAEHNLAFVREKLEELKQQQQQQQQQNQDNDNKDEEEKEDQQQQQNNTDQEEQKQEQNEEQQDNSEQNQQEQKDQEPGSEQQEEQNQEQQQPEKPGEEQEKSQQQRPGQGDQPSDQKESAEAAQEGQYAQLGQMTPAQARQLLDAQKGEEKALLFIPEARKSSSPERSYKDW